MRQRRAVHFALMMAFVALVGWWVYDSVLTGFLEVSHDGQRRTVQTVSLGYPADQIGRASCRERV